MSRRASLLRMLTGTATLYAIFVLGGIALSEVSDVPERLIWIPLAIVWAVTNGAWLRRCGWWSKSGDTSPPPGSSR